MFFVVGETMKQKKDSVKDSIFFPIQKLPKNGIHTRGKAMAAGTRCGTGSRPLRADLDRPAPVPGSKGRPAIEKP